MMPLMLDTFANTLTFIEQSVADLSDEEMVRQPPGVPNHAMWTLGHLVHSCQGIATELGADAWLPGSWELRFGYGSTPLGDRSQYPAKAAMLALLNDASRRLRETLSRADESALQRSVSSELLPTIGHLVLQVIVGHTAFHAGQLAMWRHALGKRSAAVFV